MSKNIECYFSFEIKAPSGLKSISNDLEVSEFNLYTWKSGYNGKVILRSKPDGVIDLEMDSSDSDIMFGSGYIEESFVKAKNVIKQLSEIFSSHGFPHEIGVDNETGDETYNISSNWNK